MHTGLAVITGTENRQHVETATHGDIADLIWEAPADFTAQHGQLCLAASRPTKKEGKKQESRR